VIVDPPRTGMSKEAMAGVVKLAAPRVVYVSCDIATLARDARVLLDAGYRIHSMRAFDLFPEHRARRDGYFFFALAACTSPWNNSRNSPVRQKFSGCHCTATQNAESGFSIASTTPSARWP
jgi:hypothetical protein